jgi:hypothetical protein
LLRKTDVSVIYCGDDGNCNCCNHILTGDSCSGFTEVCEEEYDAAIVGFHRNVSLAVGNDEGTDRYSIHLKNGWVFKDVKVGKDTTSSDEHIGGPVPPCPIGQSDWNPEFNWLVTQGDKVRYGVRIVVEGPYGTDYK